MRLRSHNFLLLIISALALCRGVWADDTMLPVQASEPELRAAFAGAKKIDLRTCEVKSVATLRDVVKIPPPSTPVLVKVFKRGSFPDALKPIFADPHLMGVTIGGKYIAILYSDFQKEYTDILRHELVHAYITLASPKPLQFWFQEGSAVYFSTDKERKFYGKPSDTQTGVMVGKTVELNDQYKQKLQSFHFLIDKCGEKKFFEWYKNAVETGVVDARPLLGLKPLGPEPAKEASKPFPVWLMAVGVGVVLVIVTVIGIYSVKSSD